MLPIIRIFTKSVLSFNVKKRKEIERKQKGKRKENKNIDLRGNFPYFSYFAVGSTDYYYYFQMHFIQTYIISLYPEHEGHLDLHTTSDIID